MKFGQKKKLVLEHEAAFSEYIGLSITMLDKMRLMVRRDYWGVHYAGENLLFHRPPKAALLGPEESRCQVGKDHHQLD